MVDWTKDIMKIFTEGDPDEVFPKWKGVQFYDKKAKGYSCYNVFSNQDIWKVEETGKLDDFDGYVNREQ
jgi:hypothetical protein